VGQAGACNDPKDGSSRFGFDDPMLRMQTPFFTFPVRFMILLLCILSTNLRSIVFGVPWQVHYDCYGNVLAQLAGQKRVVVFPRQAVKHTAMESHEIFDVDIMITPVSLETHRQFQIRAYKHLAWS
jgi:hypothetical protein